MNKPALTDNELPLPLQPATLNSGPPSFREQTGLNRCDRRASYRIVAIRTLLPVPCTLATRRRAEAHVEIDGAPFRRGIVQQGI